LVAAAFGAGVMNALAGGGTLLTFPALVVLGLPGVVANATSTVALVPGAMASLYGYRREVETHRGWLKTLLLPSLVGGALGSILLLETPEKSFARIAPLLVLFATVLFMVQGLLASRMAAKAQAGSGGEAGADGPVPSDPMGSISTGSTSIGSVPSRRRWVAATLLQLAVAVYGGYFGAGIGILMLALLGFLGISDIHAANGLKNFFGACINGVAAGYFIFQGAVVWPLALLLSAGAILGGYCGARLARTIGRAHARRAVILIGLLATALLFVQSYR
jgi:uncharacterized membrane protein YfcA